MNLQEFKRTRRGSLIGRLLADGVVIAEMLRDPHKRPPVQALQPHLDAARLRLSDPERQHVGRWTAQILNEFGLRPIPGRRGAKRAPVKGPGPLTSGALYEPIRPERLVDRWARAQALISSLPKPVGSVDQFIAERRAAARDEA